MKVVKYIVEKIVTHCSPPHYPLQIDSVVNEEDKIFLMFTYSEKEIFAKFCNFLDDVLSLCSHGVLLEITLVGI